MSQSDQGAVSAVRDLYDGVEAELFGLVFGEQVHLGGFDASVVLADAAKIQGGQGVDLCCCNGAGMRFLVRFRGVEKMVGIDISPVTVARGRKIVDEDGLSAEIEFVTGDACASGLPEAAADFVWSEDAWCYVPDKAALIAEAARVVRPGGVIAFTDWVEGDKGLDADGRSFLFDAMKLSNPQSRQGYQDLLEQNGCEVLLAEDTGSFAPQMALIADVLEKQLRWDALRLFAWDEPTVDALIRGFRILSGWGAAGKLEQARFVARRR